MDVDEDVEDVEDVGDTAETTVMRKVSQSGTYLILSYPTGETNNATGHHSKQRDDDDGDKIRIF